MELSKLYKKSLSFRNAAEHSPRTLLCLKQPNYTPQKQDVFGFSEITDLPKETYRGNQLRHDGMPSRRRTKDSHFLPLRRGILLLFHFLKGLTQPSIRWSSSQLYGILYSQMYFEMSIEINICKENLLLNIRGP